MCKKPKLIIYEKRRNILFFNQAAVSNKISNLINCFCSFDMSCPILENLYWFIKVFFVNLVCFNLFFIVFSM